MRALLLCLTLLAADRPHVEAAGGEKVPAAGQGWDRGAILRRLVGLGAAEDARLGAAAQELAERAARDGSVDAAVELDEVWAALARHGAVVAGIRPIALQVSPPGEAEASLLQRLRSLPGGARRFGLGHASGADGSLHLVLLLSEPRVELETPIPPRVGERSVHRLAGRLLPPLRDAALHLRAPTGEQQRIPLSSGSLPFALHVSFPRSGEYVFQILGEGPEGPAVAGTFHVRAGSGERGQARTEAEGERPPIRSADDLLAAINGERAARGLSPLVQHPALSRAAADYARELAGGDSLRHRSPTSGDAWDRVRAAGYPAGRVGENLAEAGDWEGAHRAILRSPAHHAQLLDPSFIHIGLGGATKVRGKERTFILVEKFAAPASAPAPTKRD